MLHSLTDTLATDTFQQAIDALDEAGSEFLINNINVPESIFKLEKLKI